MEKNVNSGHASFFIATRNGDCIIQKELTLFGEGAQFIYYPLTDDCSTLYCVCKKDTQHVYI